MRVRSAFTVMRRRRLPLLLLAAVMATAAASCRGREAPAPAKSAQQKAPSATVPRPSWAPKDPSPEFLRACRVLREMGSANTGPPAPDAPQTTRDFAAEAFRAHFHRTFVPLWELFGTLDDEQVARFLSAREIRIPVKSLSKKQHELLARYFEVWRTEMKDVPERDNEWGKDWLVDMYKVGAREDLSNVLLTFRVRSRGRVSMILYVTKQDGSLSVPFPTGIADLVESGKGKDER